MGCTAVHPEKGLPCVLVREESSDHEHHVAMDGLEQVLWPSADWVAPKTTGNLGVKMATIAAGVPRKAVARNVLALSRNHPETSRAMRDRVLPKTGTQRQRVLNFITGRGATGATDDEIEVHLDMLHQSASASRNSLAKDGWILDSGERRVTRSGHDAIVWILAP